MNEMSRFHLAAEAIRRVPRLRDRAPALIAECDARIAEATAYAREHFGSTSRLGRHGGLWITTVVTLLFVNVFDLGALAAIGSAVSLAVFLLVGVAAMRLRREVGAQAWIVVVAILSSAVVLIVFAVDTFQNDRKAFWAMLALPLLAAVFDAAWKRRRAAPPVSSP